MKKLLTTTALAVALLAPTMAYADKLSADLAAQPCDNETFANDVGTLFDDGPPGKLGIKVLYAKNVSLVKVTDSEKVCKGTVVTNVEKVTGTIRYYTDDGNDLANWKAN